jgi:hypothetical protein
MNKSWSTSVYNFGKVVLGGIDTGTTGEPLTPTWRVGHISVTSFWRLSWTKTGSCVGATTGLLGVFARNKAGLWDHNY